MDGRIDLREGDEGVVPEPGQHPAFHDLHPDLHLGLILGLGSACGDDGKASMLRKGRVGAIDLGFISVRKAQDTDGLAPRHSEYRIHGRGGRLAMESVAALPWNTQ